MSKEKEEQEITEAPVNCLSKESRECQERCGSCATNPLQEVCLSCTDCAIYQRCVSTSFEPDEDFCEVCSPAGKDSHECQLRIVLEYATEETTDTPKNEEASWLPGLGEIENIAIVIGGSTGFLLVLGILMYWYCCYFKGSAKDPGR